MNKHSQLATLILAASLAAVAQTPDTRIYRSGNEWIQEVRGSLPAARALKVVSSGGSVHVQGAQQNNITYMVRERVRAGSEEAARREFSRIRFTATPGEIATLRAESEGYNHSSVDIEIQAPVQTAAVALKTGGGDVAVKNISGKLDAVTGGGSIDLDQISGPISAASGGGAIEVGKVGSDVNVSTGGGNIHIDSAGGRVVASSGGGNLRIGSGKTMSLETGGGWIQVRKCDGQMKAGTGGGNLELYEITGAARIETGGGGIKVGPISGGIHAETGSGPIVATLVRGSTAFTESRLETGVGDIIVYVPDGLGVNIRASVEMARGTGIQSDFKEIVVKGSEGPGPREAYAEGSLNGGGPMLRVHTSTGNISIKRKGKE
jgi:DUF4097 and DUF4098 domain-containing protein YvlB